MKKGCVRTKEVTLAGCSLETVDLGVRRTLDAPSDKRSSEIERPVGYKRSSEIEQALQLANEQSQEAVCCSNQTVHTILEGRSEGASHAEDALITTAASWCCECIECEMPED